MLARGFTRDEDSAYRRYLWIIALATIPATMITVLQMNYLTIYVTDVLLIAPATVGTMMAIARVYDGITDPLVGWWSDRLRSPLGRRRPLLMIGIFAVVPLAFLWLPPETLSGWQLILFLGVVLILWESVSTLFNVPVWALGLEVARTPTRRAMVRAVTVGIGFIGLVIGLYVVQQLTVSDNPRRDIQPIVLAMCAALFVAGLIAVAIMRELPLPRAETDHPPFALVKEVLTMPYHRQYIIIQSVEMFGYTALAFGAPYVMRYVIGAPEHLFTVLVTFYVANCFSPFLWHRLIRRLGVRRLWIAGQSLWVVALAAFPLVYVAGLPAMLVVALAGGLAAGAAQTASFPILGDICDYDSSLSGNQRQGVYATVAQLITKVVGAGAAFVLGWMLQLSGYQPNADQTPLVLAAIGVATAGLPLLSMLYSIRLLIRFDFYRRTGADDGRRIAARMDAAMA